MFYYTNKNFPSSYPFNSDFNFCVSNENISKPRNTERNMHGITTEDERSDQFLLPIRLLSILLLLSLIVLAKLILSRTKHKKRQNNHKEEKSYVTKKCDLIKEDSLESRIQDGNEFDSNSNFETHGKNSYKADLHCNPFHHPPPRIYGGIALDKNR